jgi:hypothetical protein
MWSVDATSHEAVFNALRAANALGIDISFQQYFF